MDVLATNRGDQAKLQAEVLALRRQVQVLERQIKRVHRSAGDRMVLAALRDRIPRSGLAALLVKPETVLGWHRALVRRKWAVSRGRPRPSPAADLSRVPSADSSDGAREPALGYFRIRGELLKLGHRVAATTIRSVLIAARVPPAGRRSQLTWKQFLSAHAETLVAADFFSVDTIFFRRLYVLLYVHLASRRVLLASCTSEPNAAWLTQQARNLSWRLEDEGINLGVLIHDRDKKFAPQADRVFQSQGCLSDPDSTDGAEGQCACRALDRELPPRMPRLDACRQPAPPGDGHQRIFPALQRRAASSEPQPKTAGIPQRSHPDCWWPDRAPHPPRLLAQRLSPIDDGRVTSFSNPTRPLRRAQSGCRTRSYRVCQRTPETSATIV